MKKNLTSFIESQDCFENFSLDSRTIDDALFENLFLGLRTKQGIDLHGIYTRFAAKLDKQKLACKYGDDIPYQLTDERLALKPDNWIVYNKYAAEIRDFFYFE